MAPAKVPAEDPVTAEYDVYITPFLAQALSDAQNATPAEQQQQQQLHLLQFPTRERERPYNESTSSLPLELRIKPASGFVELDVPISTTHHYDRSKAAEWGRALKKTKTEGSNGFGIANGFGGAGGRRAARVSAAQGLDDDIDDEGTRRDEGSMMQHQTLGGQIMADEGGKPLYMVGAFRGNELHLTKLAGIVQMRPQFHHIDAKTQMERNKARREREAIEAPRPAEARIVQMMVRSVDSDNNIDTSSTKEFLQAAQDEPWTILEFRDEEEDEAYNTYHSKLFLQDPSSAPKLTSSLSNDEYLDAISGPRYDLSGRLRHKPHPRRPKTSNAEISDGSDHEQGHAGNHTG